MRLFELRRIEDETGISGTGTVAQGVIFDNGKVALTWLTAHTSCAIYDDIEAVIAIHGHNGKTKVIQIVNADMLKVRGLVMNAAQDRFENITPHSSQGTLRYFWDQREEFIALFKEVEVSECKA
jgi:hypothetical protein